MKNEAPDPPDIAGSLIPLGELAIWPWQYAAALHDWQRAWCRILSQAVFWQSYPWHPHETADQLEIPDPIEARGERDLFA